MREGGSWGFDVDAITVDDLFGGCGFDVEAIEEGRWVGDF